MSYDPSPPAWRSAPPGPPRAAPVPTPPSSPTASLAPRASPAPPGPPPRCGPGPARRPARARRAPASPADRFRSRDGTAILGVLAR